MKVRFTVTMTTETVAAYTRGGWHSPAEILDDLRQVLGERLEAVREDNPADEDADDEDEDED